MNITNFSAEIQVTDKRSTLVRSTAESLMRRVKDLHAVADRLIALGTDYARGTVEALWREAEALANRAVGLLDRADALSAAVGRMVARELMVSGRA